MEFILLTSLIVCGIGGIALYFKKKKPVIEESVEIEEKPLEKKPVRKEPSVAFVKLMKGYEKNIAREYTVGELVSLAQEYEHNDNLIEAKKLYDRAQKFDDFFRKPEYIEGMIHYGHLLLNDEDFVNLEALLKKARTEQVADFSLTFLLALYFYHTKRYNEALSYFSMLEKENDYPARVVPYIGLCNYYMKRYLKAIPPLRTTMSVAASPEVIYALAMSYYNTSNRAINYNNLCKTLLTDADYKIRANLLLAKVYAKNKEDEKSFAHLKQAADHVSESEELSAEDEEAALEIYYWSGKYHIKEKNFTVALEFLEKLYSMEANYKDDLEALVTKVRVITSNRLYNAYLRGSYNDLETIMEAYIRFCNPKVSLEFIGITHVDTVSEVPVEISTTKWKSRDLYVFFRGDQDVTKDVISNFLDKKSKHKYDKMTFILNQSFISKLTEAFAIKPVEFVNSSAFAATLTEVDNKFKNLELSVGNKEA